MKVVLGKFKKKGDRNVKVQIDPWDSWNCDDTLCYIIHPLFKQLKETKQGYAWVDKEDVPEEIRNTFDENNFSETAYEWILDQIIWASDPEWDDKYWYLVDEKKLDEYHEKHKERMQAMQLFGKYFFSFWD